MRWNKISGNGITGRGGGGNKHITSHWRFSTRALVWVRGSRISISPKITHLGEKSNSFEKLLIAILFLGWKSFSRRGCFLPFIASTSNTLVWKRKLFLYFFKTLEDLFQSQLSEVLRIMLVVGTILHQGKRRTTSSVASRGHGGERPKRRGSERGERGGWWRNNEREREKEREREREWERRREKKWLGKEGKVREDKLLGPHRFPHPKIIGGRSLSKTGAHSWYQCLLSSWTP